jgi:hypothetical protein
MRQYRLPFGQKHTEDDQEYIDAWRALMKPICRITGAKEFGFDPTLTFRDDNWVQSRLQPEFAEKLVKFIERWEKVEKMCKDHLHCIEVEGQLIDWLDDDIHYIFEAAMEATFGKGIWPKYNRLNEENSEKEYERWREKTQG